MHANLGVTYGPSQYATVDMVCYSGCQATGAGNCLEICQAVAPTLETQTGVNKTAVVAKSAGQWISGVKNEYVLLGGVAAVLIMVVASR